MDFCPPMLVRGRRKLRGADARNILPVAADAKRLPLPDACVDCVTMAFGIRNILPRERAFAEMLRVLRPGGRACILEFGSGRERIWGGLYNLYLNRALPLVGRIFSKDPAAYEYLAATIRQFPPAAALEREMRDAGFARAWHEKLTSGIVCLHVGEKGR
jgi:demethylmenaquinone methyltransferase/2-methoxy-6-polyprenyl-1,4-benzoquinol methylase